MTNLSDAKWAEFRNVHSLCVIFLWSQFLQFFAYENLPNPFCRRKWNTRAAGIPSDYLRYVQHRSASVITTIPAIKMQQL